MSLKRCRLGTEVQKKLLEFFVAEVTARTASNLVGINKNSAVYFYHRLRVIIASHMEKVSPFEGQVEVDESYFGGVRKGKRGRGAGGKVSVFGILKRGGKVYTTIIPNARSKTLLPIIKQMVAVDNIVYTDSFGGYNALDVSDFHHVRINHQERFAERKNHINGIENFWNQAKRHLRRYNEILREHFYLFLKECEWRFNGGSSKELLRELKEWVKIGV